MASNRSITFRIRMSQLEFIGHMLAKQGQAKLKLRGHIEGKIREGSDSAKARGEDTCQREKNYQGSQETGDFLDHKRPCHERSKHTMKKYF